MSIQKLEAGPTDTEWLSVSVGFVHFHSCHLLKLQADYSSQEFNDLWQSF